MALNGVAYPQVTTYIPVPPGPYDLRLIAAGGSCASPGIIADTTDIPALVADTGYTFATMGDLTPAATDPAILVMTFTDDTTAPAGVSLRFLHAEPSVAALDLGTGSIGMNNFAALFQGVTFGTLGSQIQSDAGTVDSNGYITLPTLSGSISFHLAATSDRRDRRQRLGERGTILTIAAIGGKTGDVVNTAKILLCTDNGPVTGLYTTRAVAP